MLNLFLRCLLSGVFLVGTAAFAQTEPATSPATTTASDDDAAQQLSRPRTIQDAKGTIGGVADSAAGAEFRPGFF